MHILFLFNKIKSRGSGTSAHFVFLAQIKSRRSGTYAQNESRGSGNSAHFDFI